MKVIIPAKSCSQRVPSKNWREFHAGKSLVDINIEAMIGCGIAPSDIHVSSESVSHLAEVSDRYGVVPLVREVSLCGNDVPLTDWVRTICRQVPGEDDIAWSQVCDPLFRDHAAVFAAWPEARSHGHDSVCVVHEGPAYLLDERFRPIGWQFGEWHTPSQRLPRCYSFPFTLSLLTRQAISRTGYHVGARPYFHIAKGRLVDIDTPEDFETARLLYATS